MLWNYLVFHVNGMHGNAFNCSEQILNSNLAVRSRQGRVFAAVLFRVYIQPLVLLQQ